MISPSLIPFEIIALTLALLGLRRSVPLWSLSPVWLVLGVYLLFAILGRYALALGSGVPGQSLLFHLPARTLDRTLAWFLLLMIAFAGGAHVELFLRDSPTVPVILRPSKRRSGGAVLVASAAVTLFLLIVGVGVHEIFYRYEYLTGRHNVTKIMGMALAPVEIIACGYAVLAFRNPLLRLAAAAVAFGYFVVTFAMATRLMALVPALFVAGCFCARPQLRSVRLLLYLSVLAGVVLLPIPITMRNLPIKGLIPFVAELRKIGTIFGVRGMFKHVMGSILIVFPMTGYVGQAHRLSTHDLITTINPLPGKLTDWYSIAHTLRVNFFEPYNGLGELMNYGVEIGVTFYVLLGMYFSHTDRKIRRWMAQGNVLPAIALFGFAVLLVLMSLQYNLRNSFRLVYYSMFFEAGMFCLDGSTTAGRLRSAGSVVRVANP